MPKARGLSEARIKAHPVGERESRLYDTGGMYLTVSPSGARWWRLKYRFAGRERRMGLGVYPEVSLAEARLRRDAARRSVRDGIDPCALKRARREPLGATFEQVAREWLGKQAHLAKTTYDKAKWTLETHAFPWIGGKPISQVTAPELLSVLRRLEGKGKLETAQRLKQRCGQVFRYAIAIGMADRDPSADLRGAIATPKTVNFGAVTEPGKIGELLRAIDGYSGNELTGYALRLAPLVFVRPGELRHAEWAEIDVKAAEWRIPAQKTKMRSEHIVPLSRQALEILSDLRALTGRGRYVFPSLRTPKECMSENTLTAALRRLGYSGKEMTAHGFRAMASTQLNELGFPVDHIERQLAHAERSRVRAAYNRAQYLTERRKMMQCWSDRLDALRSQAQRKSRKDAL